MWISERQTDFFERFSKYLFLFSFDVCLHTLTPFAHRAHSFANFPSNQKRAKWQFFCDLVWVSKKVCRPIRNNAMIDGTDQTIYWVLLLLVYHV